MAMLLWMMQNSMNHFRSTEPLHRTGFLLALITLLLGTTTGLSAQSVPGIPEPQPYSATYQLLRNGDVGARIDASLEALGDGRFRYQLMSSNTRGMARIVGFKSREVSEFSWAAGRIQPLEYSSNVKMAFSRDAYTLDFNWAEQQVIYDGDKGRETLTLNAAVLDPLSAQQVLAHSMTQPGAAVDLPLIDENEIRTRRFEAGQLELRQTALGCLELLRVERIRKPDSKRSNWVWLAPELSGLPVIIGRDKTDGDLYEMQLVSWSGDPGDAIRAGCDDQAFTLTAE